MEVKKMNMNKKILIFACLVVMTMIFSGCSSPKEDTINTRQDQVNTNSDNNAGSNNPANEVEWASNIPDFVPEFIYGDNAGILTNREDNTQWIIIYENVLDDASEKYAADLEAKGWETNLKADSFTAEFESEGFVITFSQIKDYQSAQLIIMKP